MILEKMQKYVFYFIAFDSKSRDSAASLARHDLNLDAQTVARIDHFLSLKPQASATNVHEEVGN